MVKRLGDRIAAGIMIVSILAIPFAGYWSYHNAEAAEQRRSEQFTNLCEHGLSGDIRELGNELLCIKNNHVELRFNP